MVDNPITTFEGLVLEAKKAGRDWQRVNGAVRCAEGRCVLTTIITSRGLRPAMNGREYLPGIPDALAARVISANDGDHADDAALLDRLLGIASDD